MRRALRPRRRALTDCYNGIKLFEIAVEVSLAHRVIGSRDPGLEDRVEILGRSLKVSNLVAPVTYDWILAPN